MTILAGVAAFLGSGALPAAASTTAPSLTWTQLSPATSPPARYSASMAYDPATGNMVLFGGIGSSGNTLSDTWSWTIATVPGAPTESAPSAVGNGTVTLNWSAPASDGGSPITGYHVYDSTSQGGENTSGTPACTGGAAATTCTVNGLGNGTTYYFVVTALNAAGQSVASNEESATPVTVPSAPGRLTARAGDAKVTLSWSAPTSDGGSVITGYDIYVGTSTGGESVTPVNSSPVTATHYTAGGLTNGVTYYFMVTAINSVGSSTPSREESATPLAAGYWLVTSNGGVFSFGDARFYGSMAGKHSSAPVVGMAPS